MISWKLLPYDRDEFACVRQFQFIFFVQNVLKKQYLILRIT